MIGRWMVQMAVVSLLVTVAALATERVLRLWRGQARGVWAVAMTASLVLPLVALAQALGLVPAFDAATSMPPALAAPIATLSSRVTVGTGASALDLALTVCWIAISLGLTLRFIVAVRALNRKRSGWRSADVDGARLLISEDSGPAVIGFRRPTVVIPEWVLGLDSTLRALVLRHEREHLERGDPRLLLERSPWR